MSCLKARPTKLKSFSATCEAATHEDDSQRGLSLLTLLNEVRVQHLQPSGDRTVQLGKMSCEEMIRA